MRRKVNENVAREAFEEEIEKNQFGRDVWKMQTGSFGLVNIKV